MALPPGALPARPHLFLLGPQRLVRILAVALLIACPAAPAGAATPTPAPGAATTPAAGGTGTPRPAPSATPAPPPAHHLGHGPDRFLIVNQHGALFLESDADLQENAAYAAWLGAQAIRVFATDGNTLKPWDGRRVGRQIARWAPHLRQHRLRLVVALVNNHRPVPGEVPESAGWVEGFFQLLPHFYLGSWKGPYLRFADDLITTVREAGATDVIGAWELGNELHVPESPMAFQVFVQSAVTEIRKVDAATPIWPGTMGGHHLQPWVVRSPIARWLYCDAPVNAYTLHAYDWLSGDVPGDMPIHWDLDGVVAEPCPNGRRLPVVVEELGTSRALPGWYGAEDEEARLNLEQHQLRFVLGYPHVRGVGIWSGMSPRLADGTYADSRRGLTSYGPGARGDGSCYPGASGAPGTAGAPASVPASVVPGTPALAPARCRLERIVRRLPAIP